MSTKMVVIIDSILEIMHAKLREIQIVNHSVPEIPEAAALLTSHHLYFNAFSVYLDIGDLRDLLDEMTDTVVTSTEPRINMAVENNVYLAKLAEQAERYEGKFTTLHRRE